MIKILKHLIILSIITSCQTSNSVNIDNYKNAPFLKRKINISNNSAPKIVIIANNQKSAESEIANIIENSLNSYISSHTRLKLINRNKKASLEEELKLYEILSESSKIIETPDYIIQIDINQANIGNNCVNFLAFIKIFSASKNEPLIVKKVEYKYCAFDESTIVTQGASEMVEDKIGKIIDNFFRQLKEGLILEKKIDASGNTIFKIDLGSGDGIVENKKLSIYRYNEETKELKKITDKAYVTNQINHNYSWIKVKDDNISYGDIVRNDIEKIDESSSKNTTRNILIGVGTVTLLTAQFILTIIVAGALTYASSASSVNGGYYYHTNPNIR